MKGAFMKVSMTKNGLCSSDIEAVVAESVWAILQAIGRAYERHSAKLTNDESERLRLIYDVACSGPLTFEDNDHHHIQITPTIDGNLDFAIEGGPVLSVNLAKAEFMQREPGELTQ